MGAIGFVTPEWWPAPENVRALTTTRVGGVSQSPYAGFNLGTHVGDAPESVGENRRLLKTHFNLPAEPYWLQQVHGAAVVSAEANAKLPEADASVATSPGSVCVVLTADCLPVLLCDAAGTVVAAVHCGWRSLAAGILPATINKMDAPPSDIKAWLGPAIGPQAFEVGAEVRAAFVERDQSHSEAFAPAAAKKYMADIYAIARRELAACGVADVTGGNRCTVTEQKHFYSYRRDNITGRMASLIWIAN